MTKHNNTGLAVLRHVLGIVLAVICIAGLSAARNGDAAITFENKTHDFGTIREADGPVTCTFSFVNTGDAPLVIISANASCGCTRPVYPTNPIKPGKPGKIKVTYNPARRPGEFNKTVKIRTNAKKNKKVNLRITGTVIPKE